MLFALRWRINILTMGDDEASTMGVNARLIRIIVIIAATFVTAACVCVTGMIGWVGLVIPHLCRMLIGADYRKLIPASMLMGAGFLLVVDDIARVAPPRCGDPHRDTWPGFVGAPFFLYLITRRKKLCGVRVESLRLLVRQPRRCCTGLAFEIRRRHAW